MSSPIEEGSRSGAGRALSVEMQPLAFMLGSWTGTTIVHSADGSAPPLLGSIEGSVKIGLDGAFVEWTYRHRPDLREDLVRTARYSFGFSPGYRRLVAVYMDDRGNAFSEVGHAPDWDGGHLRFEGVMQMPELGAVGFVDDFERLDENRFRNTVTMTVAGVAHVHGVMDVHRRHAD